MTGNATSVLFVCSENALRSPMAEGILKHLHGDRVYVDSAGVRDGPLDPLAAAAVAEDGIDISRHAAKRLDELMDTSFDLVIALSPEAHREAVELTRATAAEVEYWPLEDPSRVEGSRETRLVAYRHLRDELRARIADRFGE